MTTIELFTAPSGFYPLG